MPVENSTNRQHFSKLLYLSILAITFIVAYIYTFDAKLAMLGDNASYYMLGKALAEGEGYVNISSVAHSPNNHYPPGYPAIIRLIMLFSSSIFVIKLVNGLFFLLAIWITFELLNFLTKELKFAFVATLLILVNSHLLYYSSVMMSEISFFFFSMLSIWAFTKTDPDKLSWKDPWLIISILSFIIAYYIKSLGVALLAGYMLHFITRKKWKSLAVYFIGFVAAALPWIIRGQKLGGSSYMRQLKMINPYQPELGQADFSDFSERFFNNFSRYVTRELPSSVFPVKEPDYHTPMEGSEWFFGLIFLTLLCYGIYSLPRYRWLIAGYIAGTLGILMLWPDVWIGVRFIVPAIPMLTFGFLYGGYRLLSKGAGMTGKSFQPLWLLVLGLFFIKPVNALHDQAKMPYMPAWENYFDVASWLKKNEKRTVVVGTGKPSLFFLYSGTYVDRYKFEQDPAALIEDLENKKIDYVVIDQVYGNTFRYLLPAVRQYPERFEPVYHVKNPDTYLLKFKR